MTSQASTLTDVEASVPVPHYALKGFQRLAIQAGTTATVTFTVTPEMLQLIDQEGHAVLEPGDFRLTVGGTSPGSRSRQLGASEPVSAVFSVR